MFWACLLAFSQALKRIEDDPQPTPSILPISVSIDQFKKGGDAKCEDGKICPNINKNLNNYKPDDQNTYQCGKVCTATSGSLEYKFKGEKFGIYGFRSSSYGSFKLTIDSTQYEINTNRSTEENYVLLYMSKDLKYLEHNITIQGMGQPLKFYKLIYWPSLKAKRLNITQFNNTGSWDPESDNIGGVRMYNVRGGVDEKSIAQFYASKIWVYGTKCDWHQTFNLQIGSISAVVDEYVKEPAHPNRIDSALVYESPDLLYDNYELVFTLPNLATLNYVYYLDEPQPTPEAIPISIPINQFKRSGDAACSDAKACPNVNNKIENYKPDDPNTYQCGQTCTATTGSFEYTFTGEKFGIFGFRSSNGGKFDLTVDSKVAEISTKNTLNEDYVLLYMSEDLSYRPHTVKISGKGGSQSKLYKFVYWPTLKAKRINLTEFSLTGDWRIESDLIGGIRLYNTQGGKEETATKQIRCTKMWIYGTKCDWHKKFDLEIGNEIKATINEYVSEPKNPYRIDSTLLFETPELKDETHNVVFKINQIATLNFVYYVDEPKPTPEAVPISIPFSQFSKKDDATCSNAKTCPNIGDVISNYDPDDPNTYQCGQTCTVTSGSFEYKFSGQKFGIFGFRSSNGGKFELSIDKRKVEIDTKSSTPEEYVLLYMSEDLSYSPHTVKISGKGGSQSKLYKFVYWPTLKAKRINLTEFSLTGDWRIESDLIGGIRLYNTQGGKEETATKQIRCTKMWIYGTKCDWHKKFDLEIGNEIKATINEYVSEPKNPYRIDSTLLFETPELKDETHNVVFKINQIATLNFIYYIDEPAPSPTPSAVPISIPMGLFKDDSDAVLYTPKNCQIDDLQLPSVTNCGTKSISSRGTLEYTFKGAKFALVGFKSPLYGKFDVEVDSKVTEVNTKQESREDYTVVHVSEDLSYGEHTVKVKGKGELFSLYKLVFWPTLTAKRANISDFTLTGNWKSEPDGAGGVRLYTVENDPVETASMDIRASKIWIYGTRCSWHGEVSFTIGNISGSFNESISTDREDFVLLHESDKFEDADYTLKFTLENLATLNYVYYEGSPAPIQTPLPIPVSISMGQFNGDNYASLYTPNNCPIADLSLPEAYHCGTKGISIFGSFEYTFHGVKFALIGFRSPHNGKFEVQVDSNKVAEIDTNKPIHEDYVPLYISDVLENKDHVVKIVGKGEQYHLHKLVFWPSLTAQRVNITEFKLSGDWISESDLIGGIRSYTDQSGPDETASKDMRCSKIWVYGTKCSWHGEVTYTIGEISGKFSEYSSGPREDFVLLYESENFKYQVNTLTFNINETATLNCIYFLDEPPDPTPRPTPEPTPQLIEIGECGVDSKRCEYEDSDVINGLPNSVNIKVTNFTDYHDKENGGGAIRVRNAGINLDGVFFKECTSTLSGGAIFIDNVIDYELPLVFEKLEFYDCEAKCGGAIYINSETWKSTVVISHCKFARNKASASKKDDKYGGGAVYLRTSNGLFSFNEFTGNKGIGGALKIVDPSSSSNSKLLSSSMKRWGIFKSLIISNSRFEIDSDSDCSLFFESGNSNTEFKLIHSTFTGKLGPNSHHIDGIRNKKQETKLVVEMCEFDSDEKNAINMKNNNNFASIDFTKQVFKGKVGVNYSMRKLSNVEVAVSSVIGLLVLLCIIFVIKNKSNNLELNENQNHLSSDADDEKVNPLISNQN